ALSPYEIASRLSFELLGTTPDDALLVKADQGRLADPAEVERTVDQMLQDPRAKAKVHAFFDSWLKLYAADGLPKTGAFLDGIDTAGLREDAIRETHEFVDHILWEKKGSYHELTTSRTHFARNGALAAIYYDGRKGLFSRAPIYFSTRTSSNPIRRGVLFRTQFLCNDLGMPDANALAEAMKIDDPGMVLTKTVRQRVDHITSPVACAGCHKSINPIGYALEGFDSIGRKRLTEVNYDSSGAVLSQFMIDSSVADVKIDRAQGEHASSADQLFELIGRSRQGPSCLARQAYRYFKLRREDPTRDGCEINAVAEAMSSSGGSILAGFKKLILNRALSRKVMKGN
ncbi:MAG TPA: DUF1592 domain-containing protein, partial [Bdellovibrionota bacterium]|nr:DUF1592 domain-containing protein [Bdellovibrionota bacterium]